MVTIWLWVNELMIIKIVGVPFHNERQDKFTITASNEETKNSKNSKLSSA